MRRSIVLVLAVLGAAAPTASGETATPAQATADSGAFLPYAPAPPQPAGLCLVDSGVNANPDTEGVVVERTAIDGGSGDDASPPAHGTVLAMMAGATHNGWGMVGTAPRSIQIVSVRIVEPGKTAFPFSSYAAGITACLRVREHYNLRVINLSLGSSEMPSGQDYDALSNAIERATNYGVAVVAAAGNDNGGAVEYPAAFPSVLSVGATDTETGSFCAFSNRGSGLRLLAPGCDLDGADPNSGAANFNYWQGTSESSAIAAAALGALRAYRPELDPAAAEDLLVGASNGGLNIAQAFRSAGLQAIVASGEAAEPGVTPTGVSGIPPQGVSTSAVVPLKARFTRPKARLRRVRRRLVLTLTDRPREAVAEIRYLGHPHHSRRLGIVRTFRSSAERLVLPRRRVSEVSLRYVDAYDLARGSVWITLRSSPGTQRATRQSSAR